MNELLNGISVFENIKHIDEAGNEYWKARELGKTIEYIKWQKFNDVINRTIDACKGSNYMIFDHFTQVGKMDVIGSAASRKVIDYKLSRYACYLIAQSGDSRKKTIALAQTYFAIQTR